MRELIIDRFEGKYAICEENGERYYGIESIELPEGVREGDFIVISDDGKITIDKERTEEAKKRMQEKQKKAFR